VKAKHPSSRLIVISADGLRPDVYQRADELRLKIPNLLRLASSGASAEAVTSVYPSTTYPAHATLVTGALPREHGIYSHLASLDPTDKARPWSWFARAIKVPALWDVARAFGQRSAAVGWPVSAGAAIDYNLPEIWDPALPDPHQDFETVARHSTPHLFKEVVKALGPLVPDSSKHRPRAAQTLNPDRLRAEGALFLWRRYIPDLLLLHLVAYDQQAHHYGPLAREALAAVEQTDQEIGRIWEAAQEQGNVTLVVVSDHGFVPVSREAAPLVVLLEEGLFAMKADGSLELKRLGAIHAGGSFAVYWLEEPEPEDRRRLEKATARLESSGMVAEVVDRGKLDSLGADPDAELILEAAPGHHFSDRFAGPEVRETPRDRGTHGNLPSTPGLEAAFIAVGPRIAAGKKLGRIELVQVAPVLARLMGLPAGILASDDQPLDLS
jgi:predicted AlkP superfamily pyrophosphatase or phosphodiesterase